MAFVDNDDSAQFPAFRRKVKQAMLRSAVNIQSELTSVANHTNRANYATKVLNNPDGYLDQFAFAASSDGATTNASTDAAIETRISAIWNALAGML